jgi:hypothetical protein
MRPFPLLLLLAAAASAQPAERVPLYVGSDAPRPSVAVAPGVQSFALGGATVAQVVVPVDVFVPLAGTWAVSARTAYATVGGDGMTDLGGLGDVQVAVSHVRAVGEGALVASTLVNVPTGQRTLTADEAQTAFLLGQGFYGFRLPSLGQGLNVTPGLTFALPVGRRLSVGVGAAVQLRGAFAPQVEVEADYDPADEVLLTAGLDAAVGARSSVGADVTVSLYGEDTWDGETFAPGDAVSLTVQGRTETGRLRARALGRVRSRPAGEATGLGLRFGADGTVPAQARALVDVSVRLSDRVEVGGHVGGRYYDASELFEDKFVADLRVLPRLRLGPSATVIGRLGTALGDVEGLDVGLGLAWEL